MNESTRKRLALEATANDLGDLIRDELKSAPEGVKFILLTFDLSGNLAFVSNTEDDDTSGSK